jgi:capsular polysaccharide transport system permease protein
MAEAALLRSSFDGGLGAAAVAQLRVICALLLREMRGRSTFGYLWDVLGPVVHIVLLTIIFDFFDRRSNPLGGSLAQFLATGLIPYKMFTALSGRSHSVIKKNTTLFALPIVKPIDTIFAKLFLEVATSLAVGLIVFTGLVLLDLCPLPMEPLLVAGGFCALALLGMGIGTINAVISWIVPAWEKVYGLLTMPLFFMSGIWYIPDLLPEKLRNIIIWNPVLHGIEWFRSGFFANYGERTLDCGYLLSCGLAALFFGLAAERALRGRGDRT